MTFKHSGSLGTENFSSQLVATPNPCFLVLLAIHIFPSHGVFAGWTYQKGIYWQKKMSLCDWMDQFSDFFNFRTTFPHICYCVLEFFIEPEEIWSHSVSKDILSSSFSMLPSQYSLRLGLNCFFRKGCLYWVVFEILLSYISVEVCVSYGYNYSPHSWEKFRPLWLATHI